MNKSLRSKPGEKKTHTTAPTRVPQIFLSVPDDKHLDKRRISLKKQIIRSVMNCGFQVVGFEPEQFYDGRPRNLREWTITRAKNLIRKCDGVVVIGLARTHADLTSTADRKATPSRPDSIPVPTAYNHVEGALGISQGLPLLLIAEDGMDNDGVFNCGVKTIWIPKGSHGKWAAADGFTNQLQHWTMQVQERRDVFLGYCSKGSKVGRGIRSHLEAYGYSVVDWSRDFRKAATTVFNEIERTASLCRCAVLVFTKDDKVKGKASFKAIPRDNVLVEAGYFVAARGKQNVAIVRENGTKMPSDFGGVAYIHFKDRGNLREVNASLLQFMHDALNATIEDAL